MRALAELDAMHPAFWTEDEAYLHLRHVFEQAVKQFPDLMEPYVMRLGLLAVIEERPEAEIPIMRAGLRETFRRRYP